MFTLKTKRKEIDRNPVDRIMLVGLTPRISTQLVFRIAAALYERSLSPLPNENIIIFLNRIRDKGYNELQPVQPSICWQVSESRYI